MTKINCYCFQTLPDVTEEDKALIADTGLNQFDCSPYEESATWRSVRREKKQKNKRNGETARHSDRTTERQDRQTKRLTYRQNDGRTDRQTTETDR